MSLIAKSLRRLEKNKEGLKSGTLYSGSKLWYVFSSEFAIYMVYFFIVILLAFMFFFYFVTNFRERREFLNKLPPIASINYRLIENEKLVKEAGRIELTCDYYLTLGELKKMFLLAKKQHNIKYEAIYYLYNHKVDKAVRMLKIYLSKHSSDIQARTYLALAFYKENNLKVALSELNLIKTKDYRIFLDRAVLEERMGFFTDALSNYKQALQLSPDKSTSALLKKKIVVLEYYLRLNNEL